MNLIHIKLVLFLLWLTKFLYSITKKNLLQDKKSLLQDKKSLLQDEKAHITGRSKLPTRHQPNMQYLHFFIYQSFTLIEKN